MKLRYFTKTYEKLASFRTFKKYFTKTYEKLRLKSLLYELYEQKIEPYEIPNLHPTKTTHSNDEFIHSYLRLSYKTSLQLL